MISWVYRMRYIGEIRKEKVGAARPRASRTAGTAYRLGRARGPVGRRGTAYRLRRDPRARRAFKNHARFPDFHLAAAASAAGATQRRTKDLVAAVRPAEFAHGRGN